MNETGTHRAVVTLPSDTEIQITRDFDAPRNLVYTAWTTPELIKRWWAGDRGVVTVAEVDLRVGGRWRYVMTANGGFEVAFRGVYREIIPNERVVCTEIYEAFPDAEAVVTHTFTEAKDHSTLTILVQHLSKATRDAHVDSGMEGGMQESMRHLEQVARSLEE